MAWRGQEWPVRTLPITRSKMKINLNKEYETRDGREVKLFHIFENNNNSQEVIGAIKFREAWRTSSWYSDGKHGNWDSENDLVEKRTLEKKVKCYKHYYTYRSDTEIRESCWDILPWKAWCKERHDKDIYEDFNFIETEEREFRL